MSKIQNKFNTTNINLSLPSKNTASIIPSNTNEVSILDCRQVLIEALKRIKWNVTAPTE